VNSYHNYGIHLDSLGKDLEVLATSDDGSIEAIAHKKHSIIGIMWHPERNKPFCSADKEIVINLIKKSLGD
jgi:putative glutamine amidotransferase